ncbi:GNAT family N-acetyltransferase [Flavobacterium sp. ST-75]|uniref:GNAT family N-acetyltransferase n=1 Tax=Flavobacterium rhizophilum TaxID=3163296 RepID=A0ABW8Y8Q5_9FLAO
MVLLFKTLESTAIPQLLEVFNSAFSDYAIPMKLDESFFCRKLFTEGVSLSHSAGVFDGDKLVAFIFHGMDEFNGSKNVFNAATGVIPSHRGQRLVEQMYNYMLPVLHKEGYNHHQLEVLEGNDKAERAYEKVGFRRTRYVIGYDGVVEAVPFSGFEIREVAYIDWKYIQTFWDIEPAWQNHIPTIQRAMDRQKVIAAFADDQMVGYLVYDTFNGRTKQFAVKQDFRRKGIGHALMATASNALGKVALINYDDNDKGAKSFFNALGLKPNYRLIEMVYIYS